MANRIRYFRERAGLTQGELALLIATDETSVSRWESGARPLTPRVVERLAQIFKIQSWELLLDREGLRRLAVRADQKPSEVSDVEADES